MPVPWSVFLAHTASVRFAAMQRAAEALTGRHDFSSFRAQGCSAAHAVQNILAITLAQEGEIRIRFRGEAFVRHQVRIMVGTLVMSGWAEAANRWRYCFKRKTVSRQA